MPSFFSLNKFKLVVALTFSVLVLLLGIISTVCAKCQINITGWQCGCNPFFGLLPWSVFLPLIIFLSYPVSIAVEFIKHKRVARGFIAISIIVIIIIAAIIVANISGRIQRDLVLTITPDKFAYKTGEPIQIHGQIKNLSDQELYFYTTESSLVPKFEILDSQGKEVEAAYAVNDPPLPALKEFTLLRPGDLLSKDFEVFIPEEKIKISGAYSISVIYDVSQDWYFDDHKQVKLNAWIGTLKSNAIKVEIAGSANQRIGECETGKEYFPNSCTCSTGTVEQYLEYSDHTGVVCVAPKQ